MNDAMDMMNYKNMRSRVDDYKGMFGIELAEEDQKEELYKEFGDSVGPG